MNVIQIAGRLGADPETRFTANGQKVTSFRIATNSRRGGKEETIWWRITVWGDRFDKMISYLKKGSAVIVVGELHKPNIYNDRDGNPQASLEVTAEFLRFSPFGRSDPEQSSQQSQQSNPSSGGFGEHTFTPPSPTAEFATSTETASDAADEEAMPF